MTTVTAVSEHIARMERERQEARVREWNRAHFPQVEYAEPDTSWPFPVRGDAEVVSLVELRREVRKIIGDY